MFELLFLETLVPHTTITQTTLLDEHMYPLQGYQYLRYTFKKYSSKVEEKYRKSGQELAVTYSGKIHQSSTNFVAGLMKYF